MMHDYGVFENGMGYYGFGFIYMLIFWGLVFYIIYWVINSNKMSLNNTDSSPKDILKKRFAKGEITKKEYNEILKELDK